MSTMSLMFTKSIGVELAWTTDLRSYRIVSYCASIMTVKYPPSHGFLCNTDVRQRVTGIRVPPLKRVPFVSTEAQIRQNKRTI